ADVAVAREHRHRLDRQALVARDHHGRQRGVAHIEAVAAADDLHRGDRAVAILQGDIQARLAVPALVLRQGEGGLHAPGRPVEPHLERLQRRRRERLAAARASQGQHEPPPYSFHDRVHRFFPLTIAPRRAGSQPARPNQRLTRIRSTLKNIPTALNSACAGASPSAPAPRRAPTFLPKSAIMRRTKSCTRPERENWASGPCSVYCRSTSTPVCPPSSARTW